MTEPIIDSEKKPEAVASDKALNDDWAKKTLDDDDTRSINSSEDGDERVRCLEFNEKIGMSNP